MARQGGRTDLGHHGAEHDDQLLSGAPPGIPRCRGPAGSAPQHPSRLGPGRGRRRSVVSTASGPSSTRGRTDSLAPDVVAAHCYVIEDPDIALLAETRTAVAHCPLMNAVRGHIAPVGEFRRRGITVGLGIDNMFADYFDVVRACVLMARIQGADAVTMLTPDALELATMGGARALGLDREIGSIERGQARGPGRARLSRVRPHADARPDPEPRLPRPLEGRRDRARRRPHRRRRAPAGPRRRPPRLVDAAQDAATAAWAGSSRSTAASWRPRDAPPP